MKKSIRTRIKITKNGKAIRRKGGLCHFRSKRTSAQLKRKATTLRLGSGFTDKITKKPGLL